MSMGEEIIAVAAELEPKFTLVRCEHGWLLVSPSRLKRGVPMTALSEMCELLPKGAVMHPGIAHHYSVTDRWLPGLHVVAAACAQKDVEKWEAAINSWIKLAFLSAEWKWWIGLDVGLSSAAIFSVLASCGGSDALEFSKGAVPADAADFGRCLRLVERFGWRNRLDEVAKRFPNGKWPAVVARWDELCALDAAGQSALLREINK